MSALLRITNDRGRFRRAEPGRDDDAVGQPIEFGRERPYRVGRSPHWIKVKNRKHASLTREF
jgi:hypothetical protein